VRVSASSDDAEEKATGSVSLTSSDLELVFDGSNQTVGMRFNGITIPQGATIANAYLQFQVDEVTTEATALTIQGEAVDNAATFMTAKKSISSRPITTAAVSWSPAPWTTVGQAGPDQQTPNLAPVVEEIVSRSGWTSGNSLVIIITGTGKRTAESYNGVPAAAPLLHVEYTSTGNHLPAVTISTPANGSTFNERNNIAFTGTASDFEDGDLTASLAWESDLDGPIGTGGSFSRSDLSVGVHTVTATVTDTEGQTAIDSATITVFADTAVLVGAGDIATDAQQDEATARSLETIPGTVVTLGDNAYPNGTAAEFDNYYEPTWGRHKARTRPAAGNRDYNTPGASAYFNYFGAAAGDADKGYYSYDVGDWHIIVLNSECAEVGGCGSASPQGQWLQADLAANPRTCTLAIWHKPLFASGSSSSAGQDFWSLLYQAGADVVLSGHAHFYERFAPQDPNGVADPAHGIREFVVGTGGASLHSFGTIAPPNSEVRDNNTWGVLKLTLQPTSYAWEFIPIAGQTFTDSGSAACVSSPPANQPPVANNDSASTTEGTPVTIGVAANDTDPDGNLDPASANTTCLSCTDPANGTLVNNGDGTFTYTPNPGLNGSDSFVYEICDTIGACNTASVSITVYPSGTLTLEVRVSTSSDDAEERATGRVSLTSSDLELVFDKDIQTVGMRFNEINIPQGATIANAYVQFQVDEVTTEATSLTTQGEAVDNAATFTSATNGISSRPTTTAAVSWSPVPWTTKGEAGPDQQTPNLAPVVQEIVGRSGWASGNSLVIIITGSGKRTAESFDGDQAGAPLLHAEFAVN